MKICTLTSHTNVSLMGLPENVPNLHVLFTGLCWANLYNPNKTHKDLWLPDNKVKSEQYEYFKALYNTSSVEYYYFSPFLQ